MTVIDWQQRTAGYLIHQGCVIHEIAVTKGVPWEIVLGQVAAVNQEEATVREEELYVKEAFVDGGIGMKRMRPQPRGSAGVIRKRYSHITLVVANDE